MWIVIRSLEFPDYPPVFLCGQASSHVSIIFLDLHLGLTFPLSGASTRAIPPVPTSPSSTISSTHTFTSRIGKTARLFENGERGRPVPRSQDGLLERVATCRDVPVKPGAEAELPARIYVPARRLGPGGDISPVPRIIQADGDRPSTR